MTTLARSFFVALTAALAAAACQSPGSPEDQQEAGSLWDTMSGYQQWEQFDGHAGMQAGKSPHGKFVQTFVRATGFSSSSNISHRRSVSM